MPPLSPQLQPRLAHMPLRSHGGERRAPRPRQAPLRVLSRLEGGEPTVPASPGVHVTIYTAHSLGLRGLSPLIRRVVSPLPCHPRGSFGLAAYARALHCPPDRSNHCRLVKARCADARTRPTCLENPHCIEARVSAWCQLPLCPLDDRVLPAPKQVRRGLQMLHSLLLGPSKFDLHPHSN